MLTIKDLIRAALDNGKTVRQLEADSGGRVRYQAFQELSNNAPKNFPRDISNTITGMALALGVPETTIVLAYAAGLGVRVTAGSPFTLRVPAGVDQLDPSVQESLLTLMRSIVRMEAAPAGASPQARQAEEDGSPDDPQTPAAVADAALAAGVAELEVDGVDDDSEKAN